MRQIRTPVLWVMLISSLLVMGLIAFAAITTQSTRDKTLSDQLNNLSRLSIVLAEHTQRVVFSADLLIASLQERISLADVRSKEEFQRYAASRKMFEDLQEMIILATDVDTLSVMDNDGRLLISSRVWPPPELDLSDRQYFKTLRDNSAIDLFVSEPVNNRLTGQQIIILARRISDQDGAFLGLVVATVSTSRFEKLFTSVLPGSDAAVSLYRRDGILLSRAPHDNAMDDLSPEIKRFFQETMARTEQGTLHTKALEPGSSPQLMALHTVRSYPLMINVTKSEAAALVEWWQLARLIIFVTMATIILIVLLGYFLIRQLRIKLQILETTELRELNQQLQDERNFTSAVLDHAGALVVVLDHEGRICRFNRACEELSGYSFADIKGLFPWDTVLPPEDAETIRAQAFEALVRNPQGMAGHYTNFWVNKSGERRLIDWSNTVILGPDGQMETMISVGIDITERKKAEEEMRVKDKAIAASLNAIAFGDIAGNLTYVNQAFLQLWGYERAEELIGHSVLELWSEPDQAGEALAIVAAGDKWTGELTARGRDGSLFVTLVSATAIADTSGQPTLLMGSFIDITERKRTEEALQSLNEQLEERVEERTLELVKSKEQAEQASRAKSEFLSRMSHELRTPMNAILGFSQLLQSDPAQPLTSVQNDNVMEVLRAGSHLLDLINEVLDLARIEAGKFTVSHETVLLMPLIDECLSLIRPLAGERGIHIAEAGLSCGKEKVLADRVRLKQVLLNLLSNAIKYNSEHGAVSVACTTIGDEVKISVTDTGPGLTDEQQARLFIAFERLGADNVAVEGTGIGLALSKRLAKLMDGEIGVESSPGVGSTFWIRLPAAGDVENEEVKNLPFAHENAEATPLDALKQWDVLCIEDNPANMRLIEHLLARRKDIRFYSAITPNLGLELAIAHRPALILLDINLPEMTGYELLEILRTNSATRDIPVVAISAYVMPKDIERGMAAGFADYLVKPLDMERFSEVIDKFINEKSGQKSL